MDYMLYIITNFKIIRNNFYWNYNNSIFQLYCGHIMVMVNINPIYCANPALINLYSGPIISQFMTT